MADGIIHLPSMGSSDDRRVRARGSNQLLPEHEKSLLRHLAMCRAGFTLVTAAVAQDAVNAGPTMMKS